ncbi:MAG: hypothetical protein ACJ709_04510, partial [Nitrososphaeraceae archaeon]
GIPLNILTLREKSRILLTNFFECYENEDYTKFLSSTYEYLPAESLFFGFNVQRYKIINNLIIHVRT